MLTIEGQVQVSGSVLLVTFSVLQERDTVLSFMINGDTRDQLTIGRNTVHDRFLQILTDAVRVICPISIETQNEIEAIW